MDILLYINSESIFFNFCHFILKVFMFERNLKIMLLNKILQNRKKFLNCNTMYVFHF